MADKITLEFEKTQLIEKLFNQSSPSPEGPFNNILDRYLKAQSDLEKAKRDNAALQKRFDYMIKSNGNMSSSLGKLGDNIEKNRSKLVVKKVESQLYRALTINLFKFIDILSDNFKFDGNTICSICQKSLNSEEMEFITLTACQHYFHEGCLKKSIIEHGTDCPNCRGKLDMFRLGHYDFSGEEKRFIRKPSTYTQHLKSFLELTELVNIKSLDNETDDQIRVADYNNIVQGTYQRRPDVVVSDDNIILGSLFDHQLLSYNDEESVIDDEENEYEDESE